MKKIFVKSKIIIKGMICNSLALKILFKKCSCLCLKEIKNKCILLMWIKGVISSIKEINKNFI